MVRVSLNFVDPEPGGTDVPAGQGVVDVRAIELLTLVEDHVVSVRLRNSIVAATAARTLPFKTVGEYADAGAMAQTIMLRDVRNFGRKTARELDALVLAVSIAQTGAVLAPVMEAPSLDRAELLELFAGDTIEALVANELLSARLSNVLAKPALRNMSFAEALENFQRMMVTLMRQPNCGRKSANEFRQFCQRHIRSTLISNGYADPEPLIAWLLGGTEPRDYELPKSAPADDCDVDAKLVVFIDPHAPPQHVTLVARLEWLLGELDARARIILCRRNGIDQAYCETLEEIGRDMSVTRERIRQIEAKSLKRMRMRVRRAPIGALLLAEAADIWCALSGDADILRRVDLQERRKHLPPYVRLALDIDARAERCREIRQHLLDAFESLGAMINGSRDQGLIATLNLSFPGLDSEAVMLVVKDLVALSNGSACTSASYEPSHVLVAMGLPDARIDGALRFSWCHMSEEPDWGEVARRIRSLR